MQTKCKRELGRLGARGLLRLPLAPCGHAVRGVKPLLVRPVAERDLPVEVPREPLIAASAQL
jgi:hypothetical protein